MTLRDLKIVNFRICNEIAMFQNGAPRTSHLKKQRGETFKCPCRGDHRSPVSKRHKKRATDGRPYKIVINIGTKSKEVSGGENVCRILLRQNSSPLSPWCRSLVTFLGQARKVKKKNTEVI